MRAVVLLLVLTLFLTGMAWNEEEYFLERNELPKYMWPIKDIKNIPTEFRNIGDIMQANEVAYYSASAIIFSGAYMSYMKERAIPLKLKKKSPLLYMLAKKARGR